MGVQLSISLDNGEVHHWKFKDAPLTKLWLKLLQFELKRDQSLFVRKSGIVSDRSNRKYFQEAFSQVLPLIDAEFNTGVSSVSGETLSQDEFNFLHKIFEENYGTEGHETEAYKSAGPAAQAALCCLNHLIHDYETLIHGQKYPNSVFSIVTEFEDPIRMELPKKYTESFTLNPPLGSLILHYGVVGKQWHEVYVDKDEHISDDSIEPLKTISAEFDFFFSKNGFLSSEEQKKLKSFAQKKSPHNDLRLGVLPLAIPLSKLSYEEWKHLLTHHRIEKMWVQKENQEVLDISLEKSYESPFSKFLKIKDVS